MSYNMFCLRICIAEEGQFTTDQVCQHEIDLMGCQWVMPGDYTNGTFTECQAEAALPPGWYPQSDGSVSTFHQRYTGTNSASGKTELWTIGVTVTPSAPFSTPSSSQCTTFSSVGNGIPIESLTAGAAFSWTGAVPDPNALSAPTAAANAAAPEVKTVTDADGSVHESTAAAKASQGSSNVNSAAGPAFVVAGASLVAMLAGVAAVVL
jgi:hypothetical protein